MNKILKTVVGAACVTFACTPEVRGSAPFDLLDEPEMRPAKELFDTFLQIKKGEQFAQVFRERISEEIIIFRGKIANSVLGVQSISAVAHDQTHTLSEDMRRRLCIGLQAIATGFEETISQLSLWCGFARLVADHEISLAEKTLKEPVQQADLSKQENQLQGGCNEFCQQITAMHRAANEELFQRFVAIQRAAYDELFQRIASMQERKETVQPIRIVAIQGEEKVAALVKKVLEEVDVLQRVLSGVAVLQLAVIGEGVATLEEKIDHGLDR